MCDDRHNIFMAESIYLSSDGPQETISFELYLSACGASGIVHQGTERRNYNDAEADGE